MHRINVFMKGLNQTSYIEINSQGCAAPSKKGEKHFANFNQKVIFKSFMPYFIPPLKKYNLTNIDKIKSLQMLSVAPSSDDSVDSPFPFFWKCFRSLKFKICFYRVELFIFLRRLLQGHPTHIKVPEHIAIPIGQEKSFPATFFICTRSWIRF